LLEENESTSQTNINNGMSIKEILEEYPSLTRDDIQAAIAYGAEISREPYVEVPIEEVALN